ncbi:MAG: hypothetical protein ACI4RN_06195 [Oscillospiraceae bacterium]
MYVFWIVKDDTTFEYAGYYFDGTYYYFTVRAYRTINGTTFNGAFATKSVKVK